MSQEVRLAVERRPRVRPVQSSSVYQVLSAAVTQAMDLLPLSQTTVILTYTLTRLRRTNYPQRHHFLRF